MTPRTIARVGSLLYGSRWHVDLARAMGVSKATAWNWAHGRASPQPKHRRALKELAFRRIAELESLIATFGE